MCRSTEDHERADRVGGKLLGDGIIVVGQVFFKLTVAVKCLNTAMTPAGNEEGSICSLRVNTKPYVDLGPFEKSVSTSRAMGSGVRVNGYTHM